jgi:phosphinothricin acetyltransferase
MTSGILDLDIRPMETSDWAAVARIYAEGIASGMATFETHVPAWPQFDAGHLPAPRLVACGAGQVVAWAALSSVSPRPVYAGVAEVSLYVAEAARGQGVGRVLLGALAAASEQHGFWTLQASIFAGNAVSVRTHAACGFREVGRRERIGLLHGRWHDTILMERRSTNVGAQP